MQRRFVRGVLQPTRDVLTAAIQRGDLPPNLDVDQALAQIVGPLFSRHIMLRAPISDELIADTTECFLLHGR